MERILNLDLNKVLDTLDSVSAQYDTSSVEYEAIEAGRFALLLGGKDAFRLFFDRGKESYKSFKQHIKDLDRAPSEEELRNYRILAFMYENQDALE